MDFIPIFAPLYFIALCYIIIEVIHNLSTYQPLCAYLIIYNNNSYINFISQYIIALDFKLFYRLDFRSIVDKIKSNYPHYQLFF